MISNPDYRLCTCSHVRSAHAADGDFNGLRYVETYHECEGEAEEGTACVCERFQEREAA